MLRGVQRRRGGRAWIWLLIGLMIGGAAGAGAVFFLKREKIPGGPRFGPADELALVPSDAVGFVHIRARDLWKAEAFKEFRDIFDKAGPEALGMLDDGFAPAPSTLDRVTVVFLQARDKTAPLGPPPKQLGPPNPPGPPNRPGPPKLPAPQVIPPAPETNQSLFDFPEKVETVGIFTFTSEYDEAKVRASLIPSAMDKQVAERTFWEDPTNGLAAYFPSKTVLVVGTPRGVNHFVTKQTGDKQAGPLSGALELAAKGGRHVIGAINARHFHVNIQRLKNEFQGMPVNGGDLTQLAKDIEPLLHAEAFAIGLSLMGSDDSKVDIRAYFKDDKDAEEGEKAVRSVAEFARTKLADPKKQFEKELKGPPDKKKPMPIKELPQAIVSLLGMGAISKAEEYLKNPPLKRDGTELVATFEMPSLATAYMGSAAVAVGMLVPAVSKVREAAGRLSSSHNLQEIGLAMHNYASDHERALPTSAPLNTKDVQLSWRVQILPYIEQEALYKEFKLDEPWDSPNNKKLIERMPKVYESPLAIAPPGQTYYKVFSGGGAIFGPGKITRLTDIADGLSNTILAVEGGEPVIWTKPDDVPFDPKKKLPDLSLMGNPQINVLLADGSVKSINWDALSERTRKAAITMAGGDVLGVDW